MAQLNIHLQPAFEEDLAKFMRLRGIATKSEAVRLAIREGVERLIRARRKDTSFRDWIGLGTKAPTNPRPRFETDDDLWV
jgi:hypothetical protein